MVRFVLNVVRFVLAIVRFVRGPFCPWFVVSLIRGNHPVYCYYNRRANHVRLVDSKKTSIFNLAVVFCIADFAFLSAKRGVRSEHALFTLNSGISEIKKMSKVRSRRAIQALTV